VRPEAPEFGAELLPIVEDDGDDGALADLHHRRLRQ